MPRNSLNALEERVKKLLEYTGKLKEENKNWKKEKSLLKDKTETALKQVQKALGEKYEK